VTVVKLAAFMRAEAGVEAARRGRSPHVGGGRLRAVRRARWKAALWALTALLAAVLATGVVFAGSPDRIPAGVTLAGIEVGGMEASEAEALLSRRAGALASTPVVFTAGEESWRIRPNRLDVRVNWHAAVEEAVEAGSGPLPLRGLKRVKVRLFGADLQPHAEVYEPALQLQVQRIARGIDVPAREAALVLNGLSPIAVPAETGRRLAREEATETVLTALAGLERRPVPLPVAVDEPTVTAKDLTAAAADVRTALSAPVQVGFRGATLLLRPTQLAGFLQLPAGGATELRVGGAKATRFFKNVGRGVAKPARDADFALRQNGRVRIIPSRDGRALDLRASAEALLAAALASGDRRAELVVASMEPRFTTGEASSLGVTRVLASYRTPYSGTSDRIRNLQLAIRALDGTVIRPGKEFSFNKVVGPRTAARGYRPAPVIINGEYEDGVGGGVSQVATTVFNAAWEAGIRITRRHAHALYISRYPLGRDATVNYPEVDLRVVNDTDHAIYLRARHDETGIVISLLGAPTHRRVVSEAGELREIGPPREKLERDPTLFVGERVVEDDGEPSRAVTVTRTIYVRGELLRRETWSTSYRSEAKIMRVGTIPKPEAEKPPTKTTTTSATTTAPGG
jgi:vancomycin resistance protein YoaR